MQISQFVLYHGSDSSVKLPVWNSGSRYRDFGQCFYTTYDRATAQDWADKQNVLDPLMKEMVEMLVKKHRYTYDSALDIVLSSDTYHQLVTKPYLQEEGSLFVCELLEKELEEQRAETPAEA